MCAQCGCHVTQRPNWTFRNGVISIGKRSTKNSYRTNTERKKKKKENFFFFVKRISSICAAPKGLDSQWLAMAPVQKDEETQKKKKSFLSIEYIKSNRKTKQKPLCTFTSCHVIINVHRKFFYSSVGEDAQVSSKQMKETFSFPNQ